MNEATLKAGLVRALRARMPGCVVFRHEDTRTAGIPDISVTWRGGTVWIEVKFRRPNARYGLTALQVRTLQRLGGLAVGYVLAADGCRSVVGVDYARNDSWCAGPGRRWPHDTVADIVARPLEKGD